MTLLFRSNAACFVAAAFVIGATCHDANAQSPPTRARGSAERPQRAPRASGAEFQDLKIITENVAVSVRGDAPAADNSKLEKAHAFILETFARRVAGAMGGDFGGERPPRTTREPSTNQAADYTLVLRLSELKIQKAKAGSTAGNVSCNLILDVRSAEGGGGPLGRTLVPVRYQYQDFTPPPIRSRNGKPEFPPITNRDVTPGARDAETAQLSVSRRFLRVTRETIAEDPAHVRLTIENRTGFTFAKLELGNGIVIDPTTDATLAELAPLAPGGRWKVLAEPSKNEVPSVSKAWLGKPRPPVDPKRLQPSVEDPADDDAAAPENDNDRPSKP
ncbi:MAG: hypothetical protein JNG88_12370 [Phycisphaerales bacterium]|nr:hypothetical protein [Phycisphaerales bacterium]